MNKSIAVIGMGLFGSALAIELSKMGVDVLAIDKDESRLKLVADQVKVPVCANVKDDGTMARLGFDSIDAAVVCMAENLESSIMALMKLKENGVKKIWMKSFNEEQRSIFLALGATNAFIPEKIQAASLAKSFVTDNFFEFHELSDKISLIKLKVRDEWIGHSLAELNLRKKYGINVVAVEENGSISIDIDPMKELTGDKILFVVADKKAVIKLEQ